MKTDRKSIGSRGEYIAAEYLAGKGFIILERNFRFSRLGEIDIIAREKEFLCFIEVKSRRNLLYGMPSEAVTFRKQQNIRKLACIYMNSRNLQKEFLRFDVVEVILGNDNSQEKIEINLIRNAF